VAARAFTILQFFLYVMLYSLVVTIPMSILLAALATFTRLSIDGALLGLEGAGISPNRLPRPVGRGPGTCQLIASIVTRKRCMVTRACPASEMRDGAQHPE
jgi:hypothetical protein